MAKEKSKKEIKEEEKKNIFEIPEIDFDEEEQK